MPETKDLQRSFADFCRVEGGQQPPGVRGDRVGVYRRLVFHNIFTCLSKIFPLSKVASGEELWRALVERFFAESRIRTPQFWRMPFEFVAFVQEHKAAPHPFSEDLLRFEALDYEVNLMMDEPPPDYRDEGDVLADPLILNPEHRFACFRYPVYNVPAKELEGKEGLYYLMLFRHPDTLQVEVVELSAYYLLVLELLREEPLSGREGLELAASHFAQLEGVNLLTSGRQFLESLIEERALLGFAR